MMSQGNIGNLGDPKRLLQASKISSDNSANSGEGRTDNVLEVGSVNNRGNIPGNRYESQKEETLEGTDRDMQREGETSAIHRDGEATVTKLERITKVARENSSYRFMSLASLLDEEYLAHCFRELKKNKASGADGVSVEEYGLELAENLRGLVGRMRRMQYRPQAVRRIYIPKENGAKRALGIPAVEDKIVQQGMTKILEAIFEPDFLEASYGYRRDRGCHKALDAVSKAIMVRPVSYIVDADIKGFFDTVNHKWMMKCLEQRVADRNFLRLIARFLKSGIIEEGKYYDTEQGTPQGGVLSPILSNIYLHYVLDLWIERKMKKECGGYLEEVRYCDDFLIFVQRKSDGERIMTALRERLVKFGLSLSEEKSRLIGFGRFAEENAKRRGEKPATFDFLGFTHYCGKTRRGCFKVGRRTSKKKYRMKIVAMNHWLKSVRNALPLAEIWKQLRVKLIGHYRYYGISGNYGRIAGYYHDTMVYAFKWLNRRSQKRSFNREQFGKYVRRYPVPKPRIYYNPYRATAT